MRDDPWEETVADGEENRVFRNRDEAGRLLAEALSQYRGADVLVLALPRGGVPIGYFVAKALDAPLDVFLARKLGAPMHPELGMGALTEGGLRVLDPAIVRLVGATPAQIERVMEREEAELRRRIASYRGNRPLPEVKGKVVVLVDDGIATGGTARAALRDLRQRGPARLILAAPVSAQDSRHALLSDADEVVCLETPAWFHAIGEWYEDFRQLEDADVIDILERARQERSVAAPSPAPTAAPASAAPQPAPLAQAVPRPATFQVGGVTLHANVTLPADPRGLVVFAHGSGSGRSSPRDRFVAEALVDAGFGTVLLDLLTPAEETVDALTARLRFDVGMLSRRFIGVIDALGRDPDLRSFPVAAFGASTGAAAALIAAAERPDRVQVVVSRAGRPDLGGDALMRVRAPVLLIVGGRDTPVIDLNQSALKALRLPSELAIVPGATHLFEEPGTLEQVANLAVAWLGKHLAALAEPA